MASKTSNELEIREHFKTVLQTTFKDSITIDEYTGGIMSTRADLGTFTNDTIYLTEIKSDRDVLTNLFNQTVDYKNNADVVFLVLDKVHLKAFNKQSNKYVHMKDVYAYYYDNGRLYNAFRDTLEIPINEHVLTRRYYNFKDNINVVHLLWRDEILQLIKPFKGRSKAKNVYRAVRAIYTYNELIELSYGILFDRMKNRIASKTKRYNHGLLQHEIQHLGHKQNIFNDYLKK